MLSKVLRNMCLARFAYGLIPCTLAAWTGLGVMAQQSSGWPDYRGPFGNGHAGEGLEGVPLHWSDEQHVAWKLDLPELGLSSPVVLDGKVWLTTATEDGHDFFVLGVEAESGALVVNQRLFHSDDPESLGNGRQDNSYATPSAVLETGRAYVHFGSFGTACLNAQTHEVIWQREDLPCRHYRGASSSPVLFQELLILTFDGADQQYLIALDKHTGKTVWQTKRSAIWNDEHIDNAMVREGDWRKAHSTPLLAKLGEGMRLYSVGAKAAYAYDPASGKELWRLDHGAYSAAPRPVAFEDQVIFVSGFSRGAQMVSVQSGGQGVVNETHVRWALDNPLPKYASPIVVDGLLYFALDESFLVCMEAGSGEVVWKERVGGKFRACPIYVDGRIYFFSLEGTTTVIKPGRDFHLLATNHLEQGVVNDDPRRGPGFMASPAIDGQAFILRTRHHLYRIQEP